MNFQPFYLFIFSYYESLAYSLAVFSRFTVICRTKEEDINFIMITVIDTKLLTIFSVLFCSNEAEIARSSSHLYYWMKEIKFPQ